MFEPVTRALVEDVEIATSKTVLDVGTGSVGGEAVKFTNARVALVRDPNKLFLQLIDRK